MSRNRAVIFAAETVGTFGLLVAATGSIVFDAHAGHTLGPAFIAGMHFAGLAVLVFAFGRYSMAHFNPAVTLAFAATGRLRLRMIPLYIAAQCIGGFLGSLFVMHVIGSHASLGMNIPSDAYQTYEVFGIEVLATAMLMGVILAVTRGRLHAGMIGAAVGGIVALDVILFGSVSGASMNPVRSLAPAAAIGDLNNLWIYLLAPPIGSIAAALVYLGLSFRCADRFKIRQRE